MKQVRKLLLWFAMLSKRLYKKPTFLALMLLIPVLVFGYTAITGGESGVITIGLARESDEPVIQEIFADLQSGSQLLSFQVCDDPQQARTLLEGGKLDAVWIFPADIEEKIEKFAKSPTSSNAFITVLEREDNVTLMMSREKLSASVYPYIAQRVYVHFLRDIAPELSHFSDEQLLEYYHATGLTVNLFDFRGTDAQKKETNYLLSPLRGLLGILILLCSLAAGMYYIRDNENGTFAWVSLRWQFLPELGCQLAASLHIAVISSVCLAFCGLTGSFWTELGILLMYSLCCSLFAMALRQLFPSVNLLGTALPLVIVASLVVCPVFFDLGSMRQLQYLLPPTYYINAAYDSRYLLSMAGYTAVSAGAAMLVQAIKRIIRK